MNFASLRTLFGHLGLSSGRSTKRVAKPRNGWGIETEKLEDRALLSAAGKCAAMADGAVAAEVAKSHSKKVEIPNVSGIYTVTVNVPQTPQGPVTITDDVDFTQNKKVITGNLTAQGASADIVGKLKGKGLTHAKVTATITFSGLTFKAKFDVTYTNQYNNFTGTTQAPVVGTISIAGARLNA